MSTGLSSADIHRAGEIVGRAFSQIREAPCANEEKFELFAALHDALNDAIYDGSDPQDRSAYDAARELRAILDQYIQDPNQRDRAIDELAVIIIDAYNAEILRMG
jgi:hypothetical protein